ncbi:MAG: DUF4863 family protein [Acidobacteriota bacterium]
MSSAGRDALVAMLSRLKVDLSRSDLSRPDEARRALTSKYPLNGDYIAEVRRLCDRGLSDGWLCGTGEPDGQDHRLANTSSWFPFSIDASVLEGEAAAHGHPKGEVGLAWPVDGSPKFCGEDPGWHVFAPKGVHQPAAKGGRVFVLRFRPDGAVDRKPKAPRRRAASAKAKAPAKKRRTKTAKTGTARA